MSNRSGRKGYMGEAPVERWFKITRGFYRAYRLRSQGVEDKGDIGGIDNVCIEVKNHGTYKFGEWMKELAREKAQAGAHTAALIVKPKGKSEMFIQEWWVTMTLEDYTQLLIDAGYGPRKDTE
jgi:hypothetical protein